MHTPDQLNNAETEGNRPFIATIKAERGGVTALQEAALTEDSCAHREKTIEADIIITSTKISPHCSIKDNMLVICTLMGWPVSGGGGKSAPPTHPPP